MRLKPVGVDGILAVLGEEISESTGARVTALNEALRRETPEGLLETVPAYASLLVRFDPFAADWDELAATLIRLEKGLQESSAGAGRTVELPVCYGGEFGEDLSFVAKNAGLTEDEVIRLHSGRDYRVYMLGFLPGFPYLGGLDPRLETPRLETPRTLIPAGSVGIGGRQTGVYPLASPGGWRLIGRTPVPLDDGERLPYAAGDRIRFVPISPDEFAAVRRRAEEGKPWA